MTVQIVTGFVSAEDLAEEVAQQLSEKISQALSSSQRFDLVLTGGGVGILTLEKLAAHLQAEDVKGLHLWWGDERFVASDSNERNELQARKALIEKINIHPENIHPFPSANVDNIEKAGAEFAKQLEKLEPKFDVVLLGMGPDGHVASLFPGSSATAVGDWIVIEKESPKPPKQRLSLSYKAIKSAREVWLLVSGLEKADAVAIGYLADSDLPLAKVQGVEKTLWFLDEAAASKIIS